MEKISFQDIISKKKHGRKIKMLTAYDYPMGSLLDQAGVDMILVGDSLANVILGLESTTEIGMTEMLHHAKAVCRAVTNALVVGDMPYESYQEDTRMAVRHARQFIEEAGCDAVKLEWFDQCLEVVSNIVNDGIPVMGHVGLTPQTARDFKVQGKDVGSAQAIIDHAQGLQESGCFSIVLECIPSEIAKIITERLTIPTIGIGAGPHCDGQVLVTHDLLGLYDRFQPKFAKRYCQLNELILSHLKEFCAEVDQEKFPEKKHSFSIDQEQLDQLHYLK